MAKKERKLTPAEQKRRQRFAEQSQAMLVQGYAQKQLTVNVAAANVLGILIMLPLLALLHGLYILRSHSYSFSLTLPQFGGFLLAVLLLVVLHEAIHGLTWGLFAKNGLRAVEFGIIWQALTPYCTCSEPLLKWHYILGSLMPTLLVGFIPAAVAIFTGNSFLMSVALMMILGGGGDLLICAKLLARKQAGTQCVCLDHPYECGLVVFEK